MDLKNMLSRRGLIQKSPFNLYKVLEMAKLISGGKNQNSGCL